MITTDTSLVRFSSYSGPYNRMNYRRLHWFHLKINQVQVSYLSHNELNNSFLTFRTEGYTVTLAISIPMNTLQNTNLFSIFSISKKLTSVSINVNILKTDSFQKTCSIVNKIITCHLSAFPTWISPQSKVKAAASLGWGGNEEVSNIGVMPKLLVNTKENPTFEARENGKFISKYSFGYLQYKKLIRNYIILCKISLPTTIKIVLF